MLPVGFEPTISAGERPQTYALDRAATATGQSTPSYVICTRDAIILTPLPLKDWTSGTLSIFSGPLLNLTSPSHVLPNRTYLFTIDKPG